MWDDERSPRLLVRAVVVGGGTRRAHQRARVITRSVVRLGIVANVVGGLKTTVCLWVQPHLELKHNPPNWSKTCIMVVR